MDVRFVVVSVLVILIVWILWSSRSEKYTETIPKNIWTYWDSEELPDFISKCVDKWRRLHPEWSVVVLNPKNLKEYLPETDIFKLKFADTKPRQSDFVRLHILPKFGGVWADASVVPTRSWDWVIEEQKNRGSDFIGYYRQGATTNSDYPVIESWFFACPKDSKFITKLRDEMLTMNSLENEEDYKENVESRGVDIQDIPQPDYLNIYLSAQAVMQTQMTTDEIKNKIHVYPSDDGPFKHSIENDWDPYKSMKWLCDQPPSSLPSLIKIYGNELRAISDEPSLDCVNKIFEEEISGLQI
jgi:hypothetical protein